MIIDIINTSFEWLKSSYGSNEFLVGTTVPFALAALAYVGRGVYNTISGYVYRMSVVSFTINSDQEHFEHVCEYLYKHCVSNLFRRNFAMMMIKNEKGTNELAFTLGVGSNFGFIGWCPTFITREIEESQSSKFKEIITIKAFGKKKGIIEKIGKDVSAIVASKEDKDKIKILTLDGSWWETIGKKHKRSFESIIIPDDKKDYITRKIDTFLSSEQWHIDKGVPYHLGILLYGPPGTGKSSMIHAIASHMGRDIYLNKGPKINIEGIDHDNGILVLEDIDSAGLNVSNRDDDKDGKVGAASMSEILNILDGVASPHGLVTIATTNHLDRLDPAMIRHGRFDVKVELGFLDWECWRKICIAFDRDPDIIEESSYHQIAPSEARYMVTYYSDDAIKGRFKNE